MGLFFDVLSSINHPYMQGDVTQLNDVMTAARRLGRRNGLNPAQTEQIMSALSVPLRDTLRKQQFSMEDMFARFSGEYFDPKDREHSTDRAIHALFPHDMLETMVTQVAQKTGLRSSQMQALVPMLLPVVMRLLNMGQSRPGAQGPNELLDHFLGDDGTDLGDVFRMSHRFLGLQFA